MASKRKFAKQVRKDDDSVVIMLDSTYELFKILELCNEHRVEEFIADAHPMHYYAAAEDSVFFDFDKLKYKIFVQAAEGTLEIAFDPRDNLETVCYGVERENHFEVQRIDIDFSKDRCSISISPLEPIAIPYSEIKKLLG